MAATRLETLLRGGSQGDYGLNIGIDPPDMERKLTTKGLWSPTLGELRTFFTSSTQPSASKSYYYEVWSSSSLVCGDEVMFSVAYGHISGSGAVVASGQDVDTATRAVYGQYKTMLLENDPTSVSAAEASDVSQFVLGNGTRLDQFYAINIARDRFEDKLDPGNFELSLALMNGAPLASNLAVSAGKIITLIDDSGDANDSLNYGGLPSNVRNIVSGTIEGGIYNPSNPHYYGLVYPDKGVLIIDAVSSSLNLNLGTVSSSLDGDNAIRLFKSISGSGALGVGFTARSVSVKDVSYYYVRVPARIGNSPNNNNVGLALYSNNPTFVSSSRNEIQETAFINDPAVYITSIGMYNDSGELLAVAKMSKPIKKTPNSELSVTVRLEY